MRLYIFKSAAKGELRAFTADVAGSKLPAQFRPWHAVGVVVSEKEPPHRLSRQHIETEIDRHGFQLWRMKPSHEKEQSSAENEEIS
jgi:hypothetical protein